MAGAQQAKERVEQEKFRLKRLLKELKKKEGRGTELISLYIPPGRRISDVMRYLRQEYSTAENIKSDLTRKNVQDALVKVMERLKLFKEAPKTGLAVFCGAIPRTGPGTEKMEIYVVIPPEPINVSMYRCNSRFHLDPLEDIIKEKEAYGIISIDVNEAAIAILEGPRLEVLSKHTSGIPGKHRAGGQSARRFERLREMEIKDYFKRVSNNANRLLLGYETETGKKLSGVIISGPGLTKHDFVEAGYLDYRVKERIIGYVDTNYSGEEGVRETINKARELLKETRYLREKGMIDRLMKEISRGEGLATYGLRRVWDAIKAGSAEIVLILENFKGYVRTELCSSCGYFNESVSVERPREDQEPRCRSCGKPSVQREIIDLIDYLGDKADELGFSLMIISSGTEHGKILERIGGIAAILRYRVSSG